MRHTFYRMFCESCTVFADGTALVDGEERITYAQLFEGVESEAARLRHIGVRRGDHVVLLFPNSARFVVELFALMRLRAVPVPLNWRLTAGEVAEQLVAACCSALIASDDYAALARDALGELSWPVVLLPEGGVLGDDAAVLRLGDAPRIDESPENECALVLFTGGSTGTAKAVAYSDQALVAKILAFKNGDHAYRSDDALLLFSPLFHQGGFSFLAFALLCGAKVVLQKSLRGSYVVEMLRRERITQMLLLPPSLVARIRDAAFGCDVAFPDVRCITLTGGKNRLETMGEVFSLFPRAFARVGYGQTENAVCLSRYLSKEQFEGDPDAALSIGYPDPFCTVCLIDEKGLAVPEGEVGELWGWSPAMFDGYLNALDPCVNGWYPTGDLAVKTADGSYRFVGRRNDMVKTGGENVYALEVEGVLEGHPGVREAAVFGIDDEDLGEAVAAAVVPAEGASVDPVELVEYFKTRAASYKKPRAIMVMTELPRTSVGKVDKPALAALCVQNTRGVVEGAA